MGRKRTTLTTDDGMRIDVANDGVTIHVPVGTDDDAEISSRRSKKKDLGRETRAERKGRRSKGLRRRVQRLPKKTKNRKQVRTPKAPVDNDAAPIADDVASEEEDAQVDVVSNAVLDAPDEASSPPLGIVEEDILDLDLVEALADNEADEVQETAREEPSFDKKGVQEEAALPESSVQEPTANVPETPGAFSCDYHRKLELLRALLRSDDECLTPELSPFSPLGHAIPLADQILEREKGESFEALEELADLGLLRREAHNVIHVCPECQCSQINFRELCSLCSSFDLEAESLIHHFRCSHCAVESEFTSGFDLVCPKCHHVLHQLGQDFDRPGVVQVCRSCEKVTEEPVVRVQCLRCDREFESIEAEPKRLYRYHPTFLAVRAVELDRLTCLDVSDVMFDSRVGLATREFLNIQTRREHDRLLRHHSSFATAILSFEHHGTLYPIFREWKARELRQLGRAISESIRALDLISPLDSSRMGILFPETDADGMAAARARLTSRLCEYVLKSCTEQSLTVSWSHALWDEDATPLQDVLGFYEGQAEAVLALEPETSTEEPAPEVESAVELETSVIEEVPEEALEDSVSINIEDLPALGELQEEVLESLVDEPHETLESASPDSDASTLQPLQEDPVGSLDLDLEPLEEDALEPPLEMASDESIENELLEPLEPLEPLGDDAPPNGERESFEEDDVVVEALHDEGGFESEEDEEVLDEIVDQLEELIDDLKDKAPSRKRGSKR